MAEQTDTLKKLISHTKEYGFIFPSSEIYDGLSATYDYGPNGVELKKNLKDYWWRAMVQAREEVTGLDAAIFMHPATWKASGHLDAFNDPMIDNKDSKKRYRADQLVEEYIEKVRKKREKHIAKAAKRFGDKFDQNHFEETDQKVQRYDQEIREVEQRLQKDLEVNDLDDLKKLIEDLEIACPLSGSKNWTEVRQFNLMFGTELGAVSGESQEIYLRPETCQGIFVNFPNVYKTGRMKVPFGIAQIGKAFRNEIIARQFIFRMREFEQMEMQYFVKPGEEMKWFAYWQEARKKWHEALGLDPAKLRMEDHLNPPHYANAACDIEFEFPMGFKELEGIHSRTDHDLTKHQEHSGKKMEYFDPDLDSSYLPYVVETSLGLDRMVMAVLANGYSEETLDDDTQRTVLKLDPAIAPVKAAVLPLTRKDGLPNTARSIFDRLKFDFPCQYEEKDSIGKRYRRQDAIGTPYCVTVDPQTKEDGKVTIRERDTMEQERVDIEHVEKTLAEKTSMKALVRKGVVG